MTTLAIIGGGIAGRSVIYTLAKEKKCYSEILLFDSDSFAHSCSLRSTAIVAPRGVSTGHSDLGDLLVEGFKTFSEHVMKDKPSGVFPITQYTAALTRLEQFQKRYPQGSHRRSFPSFSFSESLYTAEEEGFLLDTRLYLDWLIHESGELPLRIVNDFVTGIEEEEEKMRLLTHKKEEVLVDQIIFCGGSYNRFWETSKTGRPIQGSYLEFDRDYGNESFSLTLEGDNLIYQAHAKKLLIGSTTSDSTHEIPPMHQLEDIYLRLKDRLELTLPEMSQGRVMVGLREKASKRAPYLFNEGKKFYLGGFYKNGFSLGLLMARKLISLSAPTN